MMNANLALLRLFNGMIGLRSSTPWTGLIDHGLVLDFVPNGNQIALLKAEFEPLNLTTLFTTEERMTASPAMLMAKQALHYVEVYGLDSPGMFDLETTGGKVTKLTYVQGISRADAQERVAKIAYRNAPVADTEPLISLITNLSIHLDIAEIQNNELRVRLFDYVKDARFDDGDDAVRWMCYKATGDPMLIKSREVIAAVKKTGFERSFFRAHRKILSQVFNRHKAILLAAKGANTYQEINKISRMSKTLHVPMRESRSKTFVSRALRGDVSQGDLMSLTNRDMFKMLNLLEYRKLQKTEEIFHVRNGKLHVRDDRPVYPVEKLDLVSTLLLKELGNRLSGLAGKSIVLSADVRYGLPISRKQAVGQLPFGTTIMFPEDRKISSGIYWHDDWGARDLDLSAIKLDGSRTGWGQRTGYDSSTGITYSGDLTSAYNGAMEFMTSEGQTYGLFVNIYSGQTGCGYELVVGTQPSGQWIDNIKIRQKGTLDSRGTLVGIVRDRYFTVYQGRMSDNRVSEGSRDFAVLSRGMTNFWTVNRLLDRLGIAYDTEANAETEFDLSYETFTFDKLEEMLLE